MDANQFHRIAKALADPRRFDILTAISSADELCCGKIVEQFSVSQATISHHLKELVNSGLVQSRRDGQYCYYKLCPEVFADYTAQLQQLILVSNQLQK